MKFILIAILFSLSASAFGKTKLGTGAEFKEITAISKIMETPNNFVGKELTLAGNIIEVCEARGCWMTLSSDKKFHTMRIKVDDGKIVIPLSARGKKAAAKGKFQEIKMTREQTLKYFEHQAQEQGKKFDPASIKENLLLYQLYADGIAIE